MGATYPRVVELLRKEFEGKKVTKFAFCKQSGVNPTSVERYLLGITEPTQSSLEKLSDYFGVSVAWLRNEEPIEPTVTTAHIELENCRSEIARLQRELNNSIQREKIIQDKLDYCLVESSALREYANFAMYSHLITRIQRDNVAYELERRNADIVLSLKRKGVSPEKIERYAKRNAKKVLKLINKRPDNWDSVLKQEDKEAYQIWIDTLTTIPPLVYTGDAFHFLELRENKWEYL